MTFGGGESTGEDDRVEGQFVVRFGAQGEYRWSRQIGVLGADSDTQIERVAFHPNGHFVLGGTLSGTFSPGNKELTNGGGTDLFFARWQELLDQ